MGGTPCNQFFRTLYGVPLDFFSHTIWKPLSDPFFAFYIGALLRSVLTHTIWGPPQISFFAYYMRASLRLVSSHTIWDPFSNQFLRVLFGGTSDQFLRILCGGPEINFFAYYNYEGLLISASLHAIL